MKCCICKKEIDKKFGNNPEPLMSNIDTKTHKLNECCDECNNRLVVPARIHFEDVIRKAQFTKCKGDWQKACKMVEKEIKKKIKEIPDCAKYIKDNKIKL